MPMQVRNFRIIVESLLFSIRHHHPKYKLKQTTTKMLGRQLLVKNARTFVTRTAPKRGGDGHVHYVFNTKEKRFSTATSLAVIGGGCLFGVGAIVGAMKFQNKKREFFIIYFSNLPLSMLAPGCSASSFHSSLLVSKKTTTENFLTFFFFVPLPVLSPPPFFTLSSPYFPPPSLSMYTCHYYRRILQVK